MKCRESFVSNSSSASMIVRFKPKGLQYQNAPLTPDEILQILFNDGMYKYSIDLHDEYIKSKEKFEKDKSDDNAKDLKDKETTLEYFNCFDYIDIKNKTKFSELGYFEFSTFTSMYNDINDFGKSALMLISQLKVQENDFISEVKIDDEH